MRGDGMDEVLADVGGRRVAWSDVPPVVAGAVCNHGASRGVLMGVNRGDVMGAKRKTGHAKRKTRRAPG